MNKFFYWLRKLISCKHCGEIIDSTNYKVHAYCDPEFRKKMGV